MASGGMGSEVGARRRLNLVVSGAALIASGALLLWRRQRACSPSSLARVPSGGFPSAGPRLRPLARGPRVGPGTAGPANRIYDEP